MRILATCVHGCARRGASLALALLMMIVTFGLAVRPAMAETANVAGVVRDAGGSGLPAAVLHVVGTQIHATTDGVGAFVLKDVPTEQDDALAKLLQSRCDLLQKRIIDVQVQVDVLKQKCG